MDPVTTQTKQGVTGHLLARAQAVTAQARASGALLAIPTTRHYVEDGGIHFIVHLVTGPVSKQYRPDNFGSTGEQRPAVDPFLPYDERLFVADAPPAHVCLLNKFTVIDQHLLLVTRAFERQESPLTRQDFQALWRCLNEIDGLAFYNAGKVAGASQPHKHLQLVPFPLDGDLREAAGKAQMTGQFQAASRRLDSADGSTPTGSEGTSSPLNFPLEPLFECARFRAGIGVIDAFPFVHGLIRLSSCPGEGLDAAAACIHERYLTLLQAVGIKGDINANGGFKPYNLLLTHEWMLIAPRSREKVAGISVNSLGFAGSLLARNEEQLRTIKEMGPLTILANVAIPRP